MKSVIKSCFWGLLLLVGCGSTTEPAADPVAPSPSDRLRLTVDGQFDITGTELNLVPNDSVIVRAVVDGNAAAYDPPDLSASDTSAVTKRADGSVALRHGPGGLVLTATAQSRAGVAPPRTLSASGRLNIACTAVAIAGITVQLQDSLSGAAPTGPGPTKFKTWGASYADSLVFPGLLTPWSTAWERRGTFSVTVEAEGFLPWRRDSITVTGGVCHVYPVTVIARLQRR
ncbi:MAG: hypothetical protein H3C62_18100 [Gemmatimonadaceae bacterium]|nr:hypothetical protein [Gemmatimonadaceae bacterium]